MSKTQFIIGQELKEKLMSGISKLNTAVSSTLGPGGRTVLINQLNGEVKISKDGVSVARSFGELEDPVETIGSNLVKQVAIKSANEAGDGTTTSTLLAAVMIEEGLKHIRQGSNAVSIKNEIDKMIEDTVEKIKQKSTDITTEDQIKQVATISGNNDASIGELIASALDKVGREGIVTIEESKTGETSLEKVEGVQFDRGYKSPYFATNTTTMQAVLEDAYVVICDNRISTAQELLQILTKANSDNKPILIIAEDFGEEALATLIVNRMRGIVQACAVKAPDFGERKTLLLEDIAIVTGGKVISKDKGHKLDKLTIQQVSEMMGKAQRIVVTKDDTTIIDGKGNSDSIMARAVELRDQIEKASSFYEKEKLQERLAKLSGGVAVISVGGNSELEIKERKDRVEDALFATKAALAEGIVPGGGSALFLASSIAEVNKIHGEKAIAYQILSTALRAPLQKILANAGVQDWWKFVPSKDGKIYDAKKHSMVDPIEAGIIDPTKVVITALRNAASVAGTILTTESVIFEKSEKKEDNNVPNMNGMF
jgi:chaperonin GroEL